MDFRAKSLHNVKPALSNSIIVNTDPLMPGHYITRPYKDSLLFLERDHYVIRPYKEVCAIFKEHQDAITMTQLLSAPSLTRLGIPMRFIASSLNFLFCQGDDSQPPCKHVMTSSLISVVALRIREGVKSIHGS